MSDTHGIPDKFAALGLTYDDVLLLPGETDVVPAEVDTTHAVCHGLNAVVKSVTLARDPGECPTGGFHFWAGTDDDGDTVPDGRYEVLIAETGKPVLMKMYREGMTRFVAISPRAA